MRRSFFGSIYFRFSFFHLLIWLVSILIVSIFTGFIIYSTNYWQLKQNLKTLTFIANHVLKPYLLIQDDDQEQLQLAKQELDSFFSQETNLNWTIYDVQGVPLIDSYNGISAGRSAPTDDPEIGEAIQNEIGESERTRKNAQGDNILYLATRIENEGQVLGVVRLEYSLRTAQQAARTAILIFFVSVGSVTIIIGGISFISAKNFTKPIEEITKATDQISHGDLEARVPTTGKIPELAFLGQAFNQMAERLQIQVAELRSFVANASHELRTPLTVIKLRIEALRSGANDEPEVANRFLAEVEGEVDRLSLMVSDMLDLSRLESGLSNSQLTIVDMSNIVYDVQDTMKARAEKSNITIHSEADEGLPPVLGAEDQLRRMLYNLVDNAIKYTSHGGSIYITLRAGEQPNTIQLSVKDTGFGIPQEQLPHIFERFYRAEATRPRYGPSHGSGLGLSISKSIVDEHGGKIWATSVIGKGTTFIIELPVMKEKGGRNNSKIKKTSLRASMKY